MRTRGILVVLRVMPNGKDDWTLGRVTKGRAGVVTRAQFQGAPHDDLIELGRLECLSIPDQAAAEALWAEMVAGAPGKFPGACAIGDAMKAALARAENRKH